MLRTSPRAVAPLFLAAAATLLLLSSRTASAAGPARPASPIVENENVRIELSADSTVVRPGETVTLSVSFKLLRNDIHAYGNDSPEGTPTRVTMIAPASFTFEPPDYPPSTQAELSGMKLTEYNKDFTITVKGRASDRLPAGPTVFRARVEYQICTDQFCLPSDDDSPVLELTISAESPFAAQSQPADQAPAGSSGAAAEENSTIWNIQLNESSWPIGLLLSLVVGLALNLTPCVLPVIPLTVGYFVYQSQQSGNGKKGAADRRGILLAGLAFAGGLVATFVLLGAVVMLAKQQFSMLFESPPVILGLGLFIVVMALGMFGVYPVQLPNFIGRWAGARSGLGGAVVMGALAAVMSTPCTGPVFGAMITFATKLPTALGLASFAGLGLGMAIPYIVLTAAPGLLDSVPRSGKWTELVRVALGFLLLGVAMLIFSGFKSSPARWQYAIWASLMLACTIWVCATIIRGSSEAKWIWPVRLALLAAVIGGIGYNWPAEGSETATAYMPAGENGGPIDGRTFRIGSTVWYEYDPSLLDRAHEAGRPIMLDLVSDKCANCEILAEKVWPTETAHDALDGFIPVRVNTSLSIGRPLMERYPGQGVPRLVFIDAKGNVIKSVNPDASNPDKFAELVREVRDRMKQ